MRIVGSRHGMAFALGMLLLPCLAAADPPSAEQLLDELGFTPEQKQQVLDGELVVADTLKDSSERELAVNMAFLTRRSTAAVVDNFFAQADLQADPEVTAWAKLDGPGTLQDFEKLELVPNTDRIVQAYLQAGPGEALNLSEQEIAAFRTLGPGRGDAEARVGDEVRRMLLSRYQAYRAKGLGGIAPYQRQNGPYQPSADLERAVTVDVVMENYAPTLYQTLLEYPSYQAPGLREEFSWVDYRIDDLPTLALGHQLAVDVGNGAYAAATRHFYVSRSHNLTEAHGALLPVKEGCIVFYANRTSTDQAAGFGSSARHALGRKIMAKQIAAIFERERKK